MVSDIRYDDGRCVLDGHGVTLRRYYFPLGTSKHIPYTLIERVREQPLGWLTGKGRLWGTSHPRHWLPLDTRRPRKDTLIVLDIGTWVRPAFSPDDPDTVLQVLRERCPGDPVAPG